MDIGQFHVPESIASRSSIANGQTPGGPASQAGIGNGSQVSSIPPLEYRQTPVSTAVNGSLSFAEQRRLEEYNREREAMDAGTSIKGNLPGEDSGKVLAADGSPPSDPVRPPQCSRCTRSGRHPATGKSAGLPNSLPEQRTDYERQNDQEQKAGFGPLHGKKESEYLGRDRKPALGKYEIKAGWLIPAVLEQQVNSDLPG